MKMIVEFQADNEAFGNVDGTLEASRILRDIADKIENFQNEGYCIDHNGNKVGKYCMGHDEYVDFVMSMARR